MGAKRKMREWGALLAPGLAAGLTLAVGLVVKYEDMTLSGALLRGALLTMGYTVTRLVWSKQAVDGAAGEP